MVFTRVANSVGQLAACAGTVTISGTTSMSIVYTLIGFIIVITVLTVVHEFGHFWVARYFGVKVLRFSIWFGKPLFSWYDKRGTEYALAWLPIGGYVSLFGENEAQVSLVDREQAFTNKAAWQKILILLAGPVANLLLAWLIYTLLSTALLQHWYELPYALWYGLLQVVKLTSLTLGALYDLFTGAGNTSNLAGPVLIARFAGMTFMAGAPQFLHFMGILSISLAVINLLPLPVLDGGNIVVCCVEWVLGRRLSGKFMQTYVAIGISVVACLMLFALYNDLTRIMTG